MAANERKRSSYTESAPPASGRSCRRQVQPSVEKSTTPPVSFTSTVSTRIEMACSTMKIHGAGMSKVAAPGPCAYYPSYGYGQSYGNYTSPYITGQFVVEVGDPMLQYVSYPQYEQPLYPALSSPANFPIQSV